jgi:hypothetical protein
MGQEPLHPVELSVETFAAVLWKDNCTTEELLLARINQLEARVEELALARTRLEASRERSKEDFDRTHRMRGVRQVIGSSRNNFPRERSNVHFSHEAICSGVVPGTFSPCRPNTRCFPNSVR